MSENDFKLFKVFELSHQEKDGISERRHWGQYVIYDSLLHAVL